ncbi:uncharacterized protein F5891DRAFT_957791, partial [Suillus fuscotomentosus]
LVEHRFERWCLTIKKSDTVEQHLPPIDVTMVWHAYLLNPRQACLSFLVDDELDIFLSYPQLVCGRHHTDLQAQTSFISLITFLTFSYATSL